ncbi:MAG TPA: ABC transporter permease [Pyrinomonadaceae bacterium]|nr:ABC transporter permease [Pyrinomonadaceae bacterium]
MSTLWQDIRYGIRSLSKRPGFVVIAVITLGLGIGANTAIFSVVNAVLLRPLPFKDPDRIVLVWGFLPKYAQTSDKLPTSAPNYLAIASQTQSFEQVSAFRSWSWQLTGGGEPQQLAGVRVSANFFAAVGMSPMLGRPFVAEEDDPNGPTVAIISYELWQRQFGSDQNIIGRSMTLSGRTVNIVGVMPQGFRFPGGANLIPGLQFALQNDVWMPLGLTAEEKTQQGNLNLALVGRLKPGVTTAQAELETRSIQSGLPLGSVGYTVNLVPLYQQMSGGVRRLMLVLLATVAFVLLIACANVANLLLTRATSRQREMAIRVALGAGRLRVIRQLLTESVLLSLLGGTIGIVLASWGISFLVSLIPKHVPRIQEVGIDFRILAFGLGISFITGIIFGLVPALQSSKVDLNESLKEGSRGMTSGTRQNRIRSVLVVSEVSLAVVLLIGATLLTRSFIQLLDTNPGFDTSNVLKLEVALPNLPPSRYANESEQVAFFHQLIDRIGTVPGVEAAAGVVSLPLTSAFESTDVIIEGRTQDPRPEANYNTITPDYFKVLRIPLLKGRTFTAQDVKDAPRVVVINDVLAQRLWPNEEVIGKRLRVGFEKDSREIIGVVASNKQADLISELRPEMYLPHSQFPNGSLTLIVRTHGDPLAAASVIREHVRLQDRDIPVSRIGTMDQVLATSVAQQRSTMFLMALFSGLALILALVGIYAVMAYLVTQRSHEIGIRLALGASGADVLKLVLKTGMMLTLAGVAIGLAAAWALTRFMSSLLFGITATDAVTFAGVPVLLVLVSLVACYLPARRATKVDPLQALRYE